MQQCYARGPNRSVKEIHTKANAEYAAVYRQIHHLASGKCIVVQIAEPIALLMATEPASALYCSSWRICAAKLRYQAACRAQHPGQNYATMLRDCLRTPCGP